MHKTLTRAALVAAVVLCTAAAGASANRSLSVSPGGAVTAVARALTFQMAEINFICNVTLTLSLNRSVAKAQGFVGGSVTGANANGCAEEGGLTTTVAFLVTPSWQLKYQSFSGILPNITHVLFNAESWRWLIQRSSELLRIGCLYGGTVGFDVDVAEAGRVTRFRILAGLRMPLVTSLGGTMFCPVEMSFIASFALTPSQTVRLV